MVISTFIEHPGMTENIQNAWSNDFDRSLPVTRHPGMTENNL